MLNRYILLFLTGLIVSLVLGPIIIPMLKKLKAGQSIREDGPQSHLSKSGTPTIGGLIFMGSLLITLLVFRQFSLETAILLFATFGFGAVGFIDDYIKVVKKRNLGLRAIQKLLLQILIAVVLLVYQYNNSSIDTSVYIPFMNKSVSFGLFYIPFIIFVVVGTVNSVNLTDGLDGLSSGVTIICLLFFTFAGYYFGRVNISVFSIILAGSLLGFLYFNRFPAKVFMGDTGSLALGGAISAIAILLNLPLILPIAGGIYFIETLSVILQVWFFKTKGKRIFLMAPLHHHFEQKGISEKKVVASFYIIEIILCIIAYFAII